MRATIAMATGLCLLAASCGTTRVESGAGGRMYATVTAVVDGDTLEISIGGRRDFVRLIGVDTPETKHPTKPVECAGPQASAFTATQFPAGTKVEVSRDVEARDRFGRLLAYVHRSHDGFFLNEELLRNGWARAYPFEPNTSHALHFARVAAEARSSNLGLWTMCQG